MVVSATHSDAPEREWDEHGLKPYVALVAGQEIRTKREHLAGRYDRDKVLMVGDALGDLKAAEANGALFYPIDPGAEDASWERFAKEALPRFFAGTYAGDYMAAQVARFRALLPERPPWQDA